MDTVKIAVSYTHLLLLQSLISQESDDQYHHCYNDIADFVAVCGCHYIDVISGFEVCKPCLLYTSEDIFMLAETA